MSEKEGTEIFLYGTIPSLPIIFCKTEDAAILIQAGMHSHLTHEPPVVVSKKWPKDLTENAVVITPVSVLGALESPSFGIDVVPTLKPSARDTLHAAMRLAMAGKNVSVRDLSAGVYGNKTLSSKRQISHALVELEEAGLIRRVGERGPYKLLFGRWVPDEAAAKAAGIDITLYDERGMKVSKD